MKQHLLDIIKIGRNEGAIQVSFSNGAERVFIDFDQDRKTQVHYIGDEVKPFTVVFNHLVANAGHIEGIS